MYTIPAVAPLLSSSCATAEESITSIPFVAIVCALVRNEFVDDELITSVIFLIELLNGLITSNDRLFNSLLTNFKFASSTSIVDRSEPSPNLFKDCNGGNSNSINGKFEFRGLSIAFLVESMACLSRLSVEDGILLAVFDAASITRLRDDDDDDDVDVDDTDNEDDERVKEFTPPTNDDDDEINTNSNTDNTRCVQITTTARDDTCNGMMMVSLELPIVFVVARDLYEAQKSG